MAACVVALLLLATTADAADVQCLMQDLIAMKTQQGIGASSSCLKCAGPKPHFTAVTKCLPPGCSPHDCTGVECHSDADMSFTDDLVGCFGDQNFEACAQSVAGGLTPTCQGCVLGFTRLDAWNWARSGHPVPGLLQHLNDRLGRIPQAKACFAAGTRAFAHMARWEGISDGKIKARMMLSDQGGSDAWHLTTTEAEAEPDMQPPVHRRAQSEPESEPEAEPESNSSNSSNSSKAEPEAEPESEPEAEPESNSSNSSNSSKAEPESEPEAEPESNSSNSSNSSKAEPESEPEKSKSEPESEPESQNNVTSARKTAALRSRALSLKGSVENLKSDFKTTFATNIAKASGVQAGQVVVLSVKAGSVVVTFAIIGSDALAALKKLDLIVKGGLMSAYVSDYAAGSYDADPFDGGKSLATPESEPEGEPEAEPEAEVAEAEPYTVLIWTPTGMLYFWTVSTLVAYVFRGSRIVALSDNAFVAVMANPQPGAQAFLTRMSFRASTAYMQLSNQGTEPVPTRIQTALQVHYLEVWPIFKIFAPGMFCALVAPCLMMWRTSLLAIVFPNHEHVGEVNINEAISCFLGPAGMVYAIFFGFCYQGVSERLKLINSKIAEETGAVNLILRLSHALDDSIMPPGVKLAVAHICRETVTEMIEDIYGCGLASGQMEHTLLPGLQGIIPVLLKLEEFHMAAEESTGEPFSKVAWQAIKAMIIAVSSQSVNVQMRRAEIRRIIKPTEWIFLLILGCCAFFGIMLVDAKTFAMNLVMCFLTAITIIVLMLFVADMDDIGRGVFVVDIPLMCVTFRTAEAHIIECGGQRGDMSPAEVEALAQQAINSLDRQGDKIEEGFEFSNPLDKHPSVETFDSNDRADSHSKKQSKKHSTAA